MAYGAVIVCTLMFLATVSSTDHIVGDGKGWTTNFDYQAWAKNKDFRVGDKLVFQYPTGLHSVLKVNGTQFQNCTKPPLSGALTSGNDTITLLTSGKKWYICGVGQHCTIGQKLAINVLPNSIVPVTAPSPSFVPSQVMGYTNSANGISVNVIKAAMGIIALNCGTIWAITQSSCPKKQMHNNPTTSAALQPTSETACK
ncbi:mavicyanin-like [Forsythia ovata]|uniref:Mavicyanin-like n=1 Tax=Forsythia ovata TaxID=205694 RepID=A0ABD1WW19_9LAMI